MEKLREIDPDARIDRLYHPQGQLRATQRIGEPPLIAGIRLQAMPVVSSREPSTTDKKRQRLTLTASQDLTCSQYPPHGSLLLHVIAGPDSGQVHPLTSRRATTDKARKSTSTSDNSRSITVGRSDCADVSIEDPDVSSLHAKITIRPGSLQLSDLGSTNGTTLQGRAIDGPVELWPEQVIRCGGSLFVVSTSTFPPLQLRPNRSGFLMLGRPPRVTPRHVPPEFSFPAPPISPPRTPIPWLLVITPLLIGTAFYWISGALHGDGAYFLLLTFLSPLMVFLGGLTDKIARFKAHRKAMLRHNHVVADITQGIAAAVSDEQQRLRTAFPSPALLFLVICHRNSRLWERRPRDHDNLVLRVGTANLPSGLRIHGETGNRTRQPVSLLASHRKPREAPSRTLASVPATVPLRDVGVFGVAGPSRLGVVRFLVAQLAGLHHPKNLRLVLLANNDAPQRWKWFRWLPHAATSGSHPNGATFHIGLSPAQRNSRVGELGSLITERISHDPETLRQPNHHGLVVRPNYVVVIDDADLLRTEEGVARLLIDGPRVGVYVICLTEDSLRLPEECDATLITTNAPGEGATLQIRNQATLSSITTESVSPDWTDTIARALAPLHDAAPEEDHLDLPPQVFLEAFLSEIHARHRVYVEARTPSRRHWSKAHQSHVEPLVPENVHQHWLDKPRSSLVPVGIGSAGTVAIDLIKNGPHALIAGTTGSGKSELLQTIILGLALGNHPHELSFILIDYKGGAAFFECDDLPHTVGLVTDLDSQLTRRALSSLRAELRNREKILAAHQMKNHESYCIARDQASPHTQPPRAHTSTWPHMARLVIVVDEFAALAQELPEFITGLVDIARRGRSLGVHLILATQRPAGVVSTEIRANTALRMCLRVNDPAESSDVIGAVDAAQLSHTRPGRCWIRTGNTLQQVQVAYGGVTPPVATSASDVDIRHMPWEALGDSLQEFSSSGLANEREADATRIVSTLRLAAAPIAPLPSPWLPPLPRLITLTELLTYSGRPHSRPDSIDRESRWCLAPVGLQDIPDEQRRALYGLSLRGSVRSPASQDGTLSSAVPLPAATSAGGPSDAVHHIMFVGGPHSGKTSALRMLAVSAAQFATPEEMQIYVLDCANGDLADLEYLPHCAGIAHHLDLEHGERLLYSLAKNTSTIAPADRRGDKPAKILLIDSWEGFSESYGSVGHGELMDLLGLLLRTGPSAGVRVAITGGRALATARFASHITERLILPFADVDSYCSLGVPKDQIPTNPPPGRALRMGRQITEIQLAATQAVPQADQRSQKELGPRRMMPLPQHVRLEELEPQVERAPHAATPAVILGIGGEYAQPFQINFDDITSGLLVVGPPASGRTNTLRLFAHAASQAARQFFVISSQKTEWQLGQADIQHSYVASHREPTDGHCFSTSGIAELENALKTQATKPAIIIVDDAQQLLDTEMGERLSTLARTGEHTVIASVATEDLHNAFRGLIHELRRAHTALLLWPKYHDGSLFDLQLSRAIGLRYPGRGLYIARGNATPIQLARIGS